MFAALQTAEELRIPSAHQGRRLRPDDKPQQRLFRQRSHLTDAERDVAIKVTKKAPEDQHIATTKVKEARRKLEDHAAHGTGLARLPDLFGVVGAYMDCRRRRACRTVDAPPVQ